VDDRPLLIPAAREIGGVGRDPDIEGQREAEPAADGRSVDRPYHRLVHPADRHDHVVQQLHRPQRDGRDGEPLDVRDGAGVGQVGTRAEAVTRSGDHNHPHAVVVVQGFQRFAERDHDVEGHGVHALGSVQRHQRHVGSRPLDDQELVRRHWATSGGDRSV